MKTLLFKNRLTTSSAVCKIADFRLAAPGGGDKQGFVSAKIRRGAKKLTVEPGAPGKKRTILVCVLLAVVVACALWQVFFCDFINLDDPSYVTGNSHIRNGLTSEGLRWAFRIGYGADWRSLTWMYWNPLTWISHMLDVQLFGLNPGWHHLTNLLLHIANTVLLFLVLLRMTKGFWQSAFVAALFGLHPLHVESVAWVAERKDVLSTFFWFLTIWAYARYVEGPRLARISRPSRLFCPGPYVETHARDLAFRPAPARLLAAGPLPRRRAGRRYAGGAAQKR